MDREIFQRLAGVFASNVVRNALRQLKQISDNARLSAKPFYSEMTGNEMRGEQALLLDILFDKCIHVQAYCNVHCVDGSWQYSDSTEIWLIENELREENLHWKFCARRDANGKLEVYQV